MKNRNILMLAISTLMIAGVLLNSCRKDFTFKEEGLISDSITLSGTVAVPLIKDETLITLKNYLPPNDSSLWAEIDKNDLVHLKMYYKDMISVRMDEIYSGIYPLPTGAPILKDSVKFEQSDTSKMKLYDKLLEGKLHFNNPKINFYIKNDIPIATFFRMDKLIFYDKDNNPLEHPNPIIKEIQTPTLIHETAFDTLQINKDNVPNLPEAFAPVPKSIAFEFSAGSHATQTLPFEVNGDEEMKIDVELDLPLDVKLEQIILSDTFPLPENWVENNVEQVKEVTLRMFFKNGFPIDLNANIYFTDTLANGEVGNIIDSLFLNDLKLIAADVDGSGNAITPDEGELIEVIIDQDRLKNLIDRHFSKILVIGKLNTKYNDDGTTQNFVLIKGSYGLGLRMGAKIKYEGSTNDEFPQ